MARGRKGSLARCTTCGLHLHLCACALRPIGHARVPLVVVQHRDEADKPTNTARSLVAAFPGSTLLVWHPDAPASVAPLADLRDPVLLFSRREGPAPSGARELAPSTWDRWRDSGSDAMQARPAASAEDERPLPSHLVLSDGTWRQCTRMQHKIAAIAALDYLALPMRGASRWRVRTPTDLARLSTFEAGLQAVRELIRPASVGPAEICAEERGDLAAIDAIASWFALWSTRMLFMKHKVPCSRLDAEAIAAHLAWERSHPQRAPSHPPPNVTHIAADDTPEHVPEHAPQHAPDA